MNISLIQEIVPRKK